MFDSSLIRFISLMLVMAVVGFGWYVIDLSRFQKKGIEKAEAVSQAAKRAKKSALIAAFLYMVSMVSVAGLFM
jgi:hypothetical protein